ncbi:MAG: hypothetical protein U5M51_09235, partial [Emticicia sp.]|nr:hypothetical protein [Emticicia sp.]
MDYREEVDIILGKNKCTKIEHYDLVESHPEAWKHIEENLKYYLFSIFFWNSRDWKLVYEYVLRFYADQEVLNLLSNKAYELNRIDIAKKLIKYFEIKGFSKTYRTRKSKQE